MIIESNCVYCGEEIILDYNPNDVYGEEFLAVFCSECSFRNLILLKEGILDKR